MKMRNKKSLLIVVLAVLVYVLAQQGKDISQFTNAPSNTDASVLLTAYANEQSDLQIRGRGVVRRVLPDDKKGSRHQKFILQVNPGQTLLVAHNIDIADRLPGLKKGETVEFYGEYEWTRQGGVMHWTHHDPSGRHIDGWLKYNGKTYQ